MREKAHAETPQIPRAGPKVYAKVHLSNWPKVQKGPHQMSRHQTYCYRLRIRSKTSIQLAVHLTAIAQLDHQDAQGAVWMSQITLKSPLDNATNTAQRADGNVPVLRGSSRPTTRSSIESRMRLAACFSSLRNWVSLYRCNQSSRRGLSLRLLPNARIPHLYRPVPGTSAAR